jgi:hypothetical protein
MSAASRGLISRTSKVMAMANTPSRKASIRALSFSAMIGVEYQGYFLCRQVSRYRFLPSGSRNTAVLAPKIDPLGKQEKKLHVR